MSGGGAKRAADSIADAIDAMNKAAEALAKTAANTAADATPADAQRHFPPPPSPADGSSDEAEEEERRFYRHLEERGELVDVRDAADIDKLPPHVTHVRYRDGRVERIGFP